jgi:ring-1,2-phenylacetyl-CoA epoxidase subunit PaaB
MGKSSARAKPRRPEGGSRGRKNGTGGEMSEKNWPLYEVFLRPRNGLAHKHVGSLHAVDDKMALQHARDVYTRRGEANSIWVVRTASIVASDPDMKDVLFEPSTQERKPYRHPTFYEIPDEVGHM